MELNIHYNDVKLNTRAQCVIVTFRQVFFRKLYSKLNLAPLKGQNNTKDQKNIIVTNPKRLVFAMEQMYSSLIPVLVRFILASLFKFKRTDSMQVTR